jgi:hypothetical protein
MSTKRKEKGRLPDFVPLIKSTLKTPAWRAMSHGARSLYVSLKARYHTRLQNSVYMSARMGAQELGSNKDYVARWHHELQHYGFIRVIEGKEARLGSDGEGMAAHVRLTEHSYAGQLPTRDFDRWDGTKFKYQKRRQKQKPVPQIGDTPSRKLGTAVTFRPAIAERDRPINWGHKESTRGVPQTGDVTSSTTPCASERLDGTLRSGGKFPGEAEPPTCARIGHNLGPPLAHDDGLVIPMFLRRRGMPS